MLALPGGTTPRYAIALPLLPDRMGNMELNGSRLLTKLKLDRIMFDVLDGSTTPPLRALSTEGLP